MRPARAAVCVPLLLAAALATRPAAASESPWQENPQARVRLVTPWRAAPVTDEWLAGLHFTLAPGWHVYWKNSGDAGYPPAIDFAPGPAVTAAEILWPVPRRFEVAGGLVAFGYADEVVYPVRLRLDPAALAGRSTVALAADLDYLVCEDDCVPYSVRLAVDQPLAPAGGEEVADPTTGPLLATWEARLPRAESDLAVATRGTVAGGTEPRLVVEAEGEAARAAERPELFLEVHDVFQAGRPQLRRTGSGLRFEVPLTVRDRTAALPDRSEFAWTLAGLGGDGSGAVEARRRLAVPAPGAAAAPAPAGGRLGPLRRLAGGPAAALLALACVGAALALFGVFRPAGSAPDVGRRRGRQALGFLALGAAVWPLYHLTRHLDSARLALVELALLGAALAAWRFGAAGRRSPARAVWAATLLLLSAAAVRLAAGS